MAKVSIGGKYAGSYTPTTAGNRTTGGGGENHYTVTFINGKNVTVSAKSEEHARSMFKDWAIKTISKVKEKK